MEGSDLLNSSSSQRNVGRKKEGRLICAEAVEMAGLNSHAQAKNVMERQFDRCIELFSVNLISCTHPAHFTVTPRMTEG